MVGFGNDLHLLIMVISAFWIYEVAGCLTQTGCAHKMVMLSFPLYLLSPAFGWAVGGTRPPTMKAVYLRLPHGTLAIRQWSQEGTCCSAILGFAGMYTILALLYIF